MEKKKELNEFIKRVNQASSYYVHNASFSYHFEKWIMLPELKIRFRMNEEQFDYFMHLTTAKCAGNCTYGQGIGLDKM